MRPRIGLFSHLALMLLLAGCSAGGHADVTPPGADGPKTQSLLSVPFTLAIPAAASGTSSQRRSPDYLSSSIQSITLTTTLGTASPGAPQIINCANQLCQTTLLLPVGPVTVTVVTFDQKNAIGNRLSSGSTTTNIVANQANAIAVTFNPVVGSIFITQSLTTNSTNNFFAGYKGTVSLYLNVKDPDGNTIIGTGAYSNASGTPTPITISSNDTSGHTTLSASTFTGPSTTSSYYSNTVTMNYDGTPLSLFSPTISAASAALANATTFTMTVQPAVVAIWQLPNPSLNITSIGVGTDGFIYGTVLTYGSPSTSSGVIRLNPTTGTFGSVAPTTFANATPSYLTAAPNDGGFWFYEESRYMFGHVSTASGLIDREIPVGTLNGYQLGASAMATGADGNAWFLVQSYYVNNTPLPAFGRIVNGAVQIFPVSQTGVSYALYSIRGLTSLPNGKMAAMVYNGTQLRIGTINTDGTGYSDFVVPSSSGLPTNFVSFGADGNYYITGINTPGLYDVAPASGSATMLCPFGDNNQQRSSITALPGNRFFTILNAQMYAYTVGSTTSCYSSPVASGVGNVYSINDAVYAADGYIYAYGGSGSNSIFRIAF